MAKFKIVKKYSLSFLGDEWKECYLEFTPFTIRELTSDITKLTQIDTDNPKDVVEGTKSTLGLIKEHFVSGTAIGEDGSVVKVSASDLEDMPAEVLAGVLRFLSQNLVEASQTHSGQSSEEAEKPQ